MGSKVVGALIVLGVVAVIGLTVWYEASLWNECRRTNSFFYCARVLH